VKTIVAKSNHLEHLSVLQKITFSQNHSTQHPPPCHQENNPLIKDLQPLFTAVWQMKLQGFKMKIMIPVMMGRRKKLPSQWQGFLKEGQQLQLQEFWAKSWWLTKKAPPSAAASTPTTARATASPGSVSRARAFQSPPVMTARSTNSIQASQGISIANHASPPAVAHMSVAAPQAMQPSLPIQEAGQRQSPPAHSVAAIPVQGDHLDDASSLSATENGNHKAMRMLHQYFVSLAASGTVRSLVEERDLITDKLGIIFSKVKFINADLDLSFEGDIAKVLYKEMKIPEAYKSIWWEQMKGHVRKKMDEKRSNCGAAIKKSIISKCFLFIALFLIKFSELTIFQFFHSQVY